MTPQQAALLKRLIVADRQFHTRRAQGKEVTRDSRGVEIGWINGVDPRTAKSLMDAGLAEGLDPGINRSNYLFLGSYDPYETDEEA